MSNELTFRDRFVLVAGEKPYAWGAKRQLPKHFITSCLRGNFKPQKKNLEKLVEVTGIPEYWWLNGEGPPPEADPALIKNDDGVRDGPVPRTAIAPPQASCSDAQEEARMYLVGSNGNAADPMEIDGNLLCLCLQACEFVHGERFGKSAAALQLEFAVDLYNLLVRVARQRPGGGPVTIGDFSRLEVEGLVEQLRLFLRMNWARKFPPLRTNKLIW